MYLMCIMSGVTKKEQEFVDTVWSYYSSNGRTMPWRETENDGSYDPYKILVSEMMLQQTQVERVVPKYTAFLHQFPTPEVLAEARLANVIDAWSGLGYNRRAKYLHEADKALVNRTAQFTVESLVALKGIGRNTAAAIVVYSFDKPELFVETNIRTALIYHFFPDKNNVEDQAIVDRLSLLIDQENTREFYWALMDYGSFLKKSGIRNNKQSKVYTKQSRFEGSRRQLRGKVLRHVSTPKKIGTLQAAMRDKRLNKVLVDLQAEGLIKIEDSLVSLP